MTIAEYVKSVTGIEYDKDFADVAQVTAKILELDNVTFINSDANEWFRENQDKRYDLIFSFAVHHWIGMNSEDYSKVVSQLLLPGGYLVFESHGIKDGEEFIAAFEAKGMKKLRSGTAGNLDPVDNYPRMWAVFQKN